MAKVVKMQVFDFQGDAGPMKHRTDRPVILRRDPVVFALPVRSLFAQECPGVIPGRSEEWDALVVGLLAPWILPVPDQRPTRSRLDIRPTHVADLLLAHRGRYSEADDPPDRCDPERIVAK